MARVLLGVSGGIAAYKAVELVRLATRAGHAVRVVQTPRSLEFVGRATFAGVTGAPVLVDEFEPDPARGAYPGDPAPDHDPISHLELVTRADAMCIAPASANTIAKLAGGHADNLLTSAALAATCPLVVAPAMNDRMYEHPATRANLATLSDRGAHVVPPGTGRLASRGEWGVGRLAEPPEILAAVERAAGARLRAALARRDARAWSPPAGPASRSTRSGMSATARRAGWASTWPRRPPAAARRSRWWPPTSRSNARTRSSTSTWRPPRSSGKPWCAPPPRRTWC